MKSLDKGIQTGLTREFDESGVCLSGGEEQKIAIARAMAQDGEIIMDEPSAALDPIAEHHLHSNIKNMRKIKTVIYISHRLSITKEVDYIYVLENGKIAEAGSRQELMVLNGMYARMFRIQAKKCDIETD